MTGIQKVLITLLFTLLLSFSSYAMAAVVGGTFFYSAERDGMLLRYDVEKTSYQGSDAWHIQWKYRQVEAEHYIRRTDNAPLYVKRVNHDLRQTIEIIYSTQPDQPHLYRRTQNSKTMERKLWQTDIMDIGTLPQILLALRSSDSPEELLFSIIDYSDGEIYKLVARQHGYRQESLNGKQTRCIIYDINIDSWLSAFNKPVRMLIPVQGNDINFASYSGPDLADSGNVDDFHFSHKATNVALLLTQEREQ